MSSPPAAGAASGLVYSEKSIDIARTTIMGAAVSKDAAGVTKLEETKFIKIPELTSMNFEIHLTLEEAKKSMATAELGGEPIGILYNGVFTPLAPNPDTEALKALGAELAGIAPGPGTWQFGSMQSGQFSTAPSGSVGDFLNARAKWQAYVDEHKSGEPKTEELFNVDLNTLISVDVQLEMMYHTTVYTEEHN